MQPKANGPSGHGVRAGRAGATEPGPRTGTLDETGRAGTLGESCLPPVGVVLVDHGQDVSVLEVKPRLRARVKVVFERVVGEERLCIETGMTNTHFRTLWYFRT